MNLDPDSELPRCYSHEDTSSATCMTCDYQLSCRETLRMGAGTSITVIDDAVDSIREDFETLLDEPGVPLDTDDEDDDEESE